MATNRRDAYHAAEDLVAEATEQLEDLEHLLRVAERTGRYDAACELAQSAADRREELGRLRAEAERRLAEWEAGSD